MEQGISPLSYCGTAACGLRPWLYRGCISVSDTEMCPSRKHITSQEPSSSAAHQCPGTLALSGSYPLLLLLPLPSDPLGLPCCVPPGIPDVFWLMVFCTSPSLLPRLFPPTSGQSHCSVDVAGFICLSLHTTPSREASSPSITPHWFRFCYNM